MFDRDNISNVNITVTDGNNTLMLSNDQFGFFLDGMIDNLGQSASTTEIVFVSMNDNKTLYDALLSKQKLFFYDNYNIFNIDADNQANLLNSFVLTEVPFGIPNYLPIGFLGVVVGMDRLKKWKNKKK